MYEQVFNLNSRPFTSTPYVKHFYPAKAISGARDLCRLIIDRGAGPVVIVGDHGTGKTLLLALLEEQYASEYKVVNLSCSMLQSKADLLQSVLFETQQDYRGMNESEMRLGLIEYVKTNDNCGSGVLLLLDDAQKLSRDSIEELQLLTNFIRDGQPRVRLVLAGSRGLEDRLADTGLESFNQRISGRFFLECLDREEVISYVKTHIENAGGAPDDIFEGEAYRAISDVSEGRPRIINQVCDHAMIFAATRGIQSISDTLIREAWMDVQKLPCGINTSVSGPEASSPLVSVDDSDGWTVLEFGELESEPTNSVAVEVESQELDQSPQTEVDVPTPAATEIYDSLAEIESFVTEDSATGEDDIAPETIVAGETIAEFAEQANAIGITAVQSSESGFDSTFEHSAPEQLESEEAVVSVEENEQEFQQFETVAESGQSEVASDESVLEETVANDPFANDEFEDEEVLTDTYSPFVAQQNQRSLSVTTDHLRDLMPADMPSVEYHSSADIEAEDHDQLQLTATIDDDPEESFPTFETALEAPAPVRERVQREYEQREELDTRYETEGLGADSFSEEFVVRSELSELTGLTQPQDEFESARVELNPVVSEEQPVDIESHFVPLDPDAASLVENPDVEESFDSSDDAEAVNEPESNTEPEETGGRRAQLSTFLPPSAVPVEKESEEEPAAKDKFHEQAEEPNDPEISRMAADIIRSLNTEPETLTDPVSHETTRSEIEEETAAIESTIQQTLEQRGDSASGNIGSSPAVVLPGATQQTTQWGPGNRIQQQETIPPTLSVAATEDVTSQESAILSEIQNQASMLDLAASQTSQHSEPLDDRDILNVSQNIDDANKPPASTDADAELPSWSKEEPSRGEANRVDYQQLFNQLRNINPED